MNKKHLILLAAVIFISTGLFAATSFSGYAGGKLNYAANPEEEDFDPDLKLQAFFAGQFNFSQNVWSHLEFSIDTGDFLSQSIFHETESLFQIDEISLICRANLYNSANYLSAFMGTYDPIGSDIFLQRYFNIKPIDSKLTESYLGLAGSILYPHFGIGISDVVKLYSQPIAFGGYVYVNHEDKDYYVINTDIRFASVLSYFTCDFACGLGIPLADKYKGEDVIIAVEKAYWHAGTTILFGNSFTNSLFIQAGIYNASFRAKESSIVAPEDVYILLEPRFKIKNTHLNLSIYSLPEQTVAKLLLVDDTLGINFNFYSEASLASSNSITYGSHLNISLIGKNFQDLKEIADVTSDDLNITVTPYLESQFLSGQIHLQASIRLMDFVRERPGHAFSLDLGYRTKF
ncbi:hypothetical protein [Treponema bryantii]|uniref:hypothetical protein n=1 Tax=Treponema bryantii TaxID=163 RepID=UPI0003B72EAC|nr:hypothetical protein [Treponema bryantii]